MEKPVRVRVTSLLKDEERSREVLRLLERGFARWLGPKEIEIVSGSGIGSAEADLIVVICGEKGLLFAEVTIGGESVSIRDEDSAEFATKVAAALFQRHLSDLLSQMRVAREKEAAERT